MITQKCRPEHQVGHGRGPHPLLGGDSIFPMTASVTSIACLGPSWVAALEGNTSVTPSISVQRRRSRARQGVDAGRRQPRDPIAAEACGVGCRRAEAIGTVGTLGTVAAPALLLQVTVEHTTRHRAADNAHVDGSHRPDDAPSRDRVGNPAQPRPRAPTDAGGSPRPCSRSALRRSSSRLPSRSEACRRRHRRRRTR